MKTHFDIDKLIDAGIIRNELEYERALAAFIRLSALSEKDENFEPKCSKLGDLVYEYEKKHWSDSDKITDEQVEENEKAEKIVEAEWAFFVARREIIRKKLSALDLTQENLMYILGNKSKTHMSEQLNGLKPFTLPDLVAISHLLRIEMNKLVPNFLPYEKAMKMQKAIADLDKPALFKKFTAAVML